LSGHRAGLRRLATALDLLCLPVIMICFIVTAISG